MVTSVQPSRERAGKSSPFRRALDVIDDRLGINALQYPVP